MGAFVMDIIVIFLWRGMIRLFLLIKSYKWRRQMAVVVDIATPRALTPGAFVEVFYEFADRGKPVRGASRIPFLVWKSAERYAQAIRRGSSIVVRVDPTDIERSAFFDQDQFVKA